MASTNKNTVDVDSLPGCAVPECSRRAFADASVPVFDGEWAYVCKGHFNQYGCKLGSDKGQKLVVNPPFGDYQK